MSLQEQLAWERECRERGSEAYYAAQDRLRDSGQGDQTDVMSYLLRDRLVEVADDLKADAESGVVGRGAKYNKLLRQSANDGQDYLKVAYIGIKSVLKALAVQRDNNTVTAICSDIGKRLEADVKCILFEAQHPAYFEKVMHSFKTQKVSDYNHKHKVMIMKFNEFDIEWNDWTPIHRIQLGSKVLRSILKIFPDVMFLSRQWNRNKMTLRIQTTAQFDDWAAEFEKEKGLLYPVWLPLKIKPMDWESHSVGGYYSTAMNMKFIKTKSNEHKKFVENTMPHDHMAAVNKLQHTPWQINQDVLKVQREIYESGLQIGMPSKVPITPPPFPEHLKDIEKDDLTDEQRQEISDWKVIAKRQYAKEQQRKGQVLSFMQTHKLALELSQWDKFYYVYSCDFRGRIYCATTGLSPQGSDSAKGLLRFAKGVPLGKDGAKWLAIQGANTYGEDKLPYDERVDWVHKHSQLISKVAEDPISHRDFWGNADKPYQFLAFCFEWVASNCGKDETFVSHLPIALDGSCNGLQHYSAMLRDKVGAHATNLSECEKPQDIYQEVADVTAQKLRQSDDHRAEKWLKVGISRKCAKRPVMTLPYGATQTSARAYIMEYVQENWAKFNLDEKHQWDYAQFLTPFLWEAIGEVVIAAREAMDWLQSNSKHGYIKWLTPLGFPVYQYYKKVESIMAHTMLDGHVRLSVSDWNTEGEPHKRNQRNGIAPNFIHSIDSTHMVMTINESDATAYAMIHDDFGTHAGNTSEFFTLIRETFYNLYGNFDPLVDWAEQMDLDTDTLPETGDYKIEDILSADYFFG